MSSAILPPLPESLLDLRPVLVGTAARLAYGGAPLHQPPEVYVEGRADALPGAPDPEAPGWSRVGPWRVRAVDSVPDALEARGLSLDAFGVGPGGEIIDPLGGFDDLGEGRWRMPSKEAFQRCPELVVRVIALASEMQFHIEDSFVNGLNDYAAGVFNAERNALRIALTQLLVGRRPSLALQLLARTQVLHYALPEVATLIGLHKSSRYHHKDVWRHTKTVVMQAVPQPRIRWAALLHDIGKPQTRSFEAPATVHFFRHDDLGAYMFEGIAERLKFPPAQAERIRALIQYHLRANLYGSNWSDAAVRRFAKEIGDLMKDLLLLSRADVTSKRRGRRREAMYNLHELQTRLAAVARIDAERKHSIPKGLGRYIISDLGIAPGPKVGELRRVCEAAVRAGTLPESAGIPDCIEYLRVTMKEGGAE